LGLLPQRRSGTCFAHRHHPVGDGAPVILQSYSTKEIS
jgi:hypothetical protein